MAAYVLIEFLLSGTVAVARSVIVARYV